MKEFGYYLIFLVVFSLICAVVDNNAEARKVEIKKLDMQWKLDSTDKAERRKMDKDLRTLRLKIRK